MARATRMEDSVERKELLSDFEETMDSNITMEPKSPQQAEWPVVSVNNHRRSKRSLLLSGSRQQRSRANRRNSSSRGLRRDLWNQIAHRREDDLRISPTKDGYELNSARSSSLSVFRCPRVEQTDQFSS